MRAQYYDWKGSGNAKLQEYAKKGYTATETAELMGLTLNTVYSAAARAGISFTKKYRLGGPQWFSLLPPELKVWVVDNIPIGTTHQEFLVAMIRDAYNEDKDAKARRLAEQPAED